MHEDNIAKTRACTEKDRQLADMEKKLAETKASEEMANMMVGPLVSIVLRAALPPNPACAHNPRHLCSQPPPPN